MVDNIFIFNRKIIKEYLLDNTLSQMESMLWNLYDSLVIEDIDKYGNCLREILTTLSDHALYGSTFNIHMFEMYIELLEWKQLQVKAVLNTDINIRLIKLVKDIYNDIEVLNRNEQLMLRNIINTCTNSNNDEIQIVFGYQVDELVKNNVNNVNYSTRFVKYVTDFITSFNNNIYV